MGENGIVSFSDETPSPGFNFSPSLTKPVALGATLRIRTSASDLSRSQVAVSQPDILSIQTVETIEESSESRITVQATAKGETGLKVTLSDDRNDYINVSTEAVATSDIWIFPWDSLIPLDATLWTQGVRALPNTNLTVFGHMESASGQTLTGHHALEWHVDTAANASIQPAEHSDFAVFKSGTEPGENTLNFGNFPPLEIPTITSDQVSRMSIISPFQSIYQVDAGASLILHAALFTEDDGYVVGIDDEPVIFETEGAVLGQLINHSDENAMDSLNLERAYRQGRATDFQAEQPGTYTVTARWKGLESTLLINVIQRQSTPSDVQPQE